MTKTIIDEYFFYQEKFTKTYGNMTIVFMMIGGFYEAYATEKQGFELSTISEITDIVKTKKNKKIDKVDNKNPYMVGFNNAALDKYLKILIDHGFTVVIIDQITPPPNPKRAVTGIYSAGTYVHDSNSLDSNNIVSIYIEDEKQINGGHLSCIGLSSIDLTTGDCCVYETFPTINDEKYSLDEAYRFILSQNPREVIITRKMLEGVSVNKENLLNYLELENKNIHYKETIDKNYIKLSYQNEFFNKVYKNIGMQTPIEYLDMEKMSYARISFISLLDFAYKHNENFINYLNRPEIFYNNKHLILGNNAIYQLNILENNTLDTQNTKFKSLFDVINNTSTAMGRRMLKKTICQPLNDYNEIELRYNCVEEMIKNDLYIKIDESLKNIIDIEKLTRKIFLGLIKPFELSNLIETFTSIRYIFTLLSKTKYNKKFTPDNKIVNKLNDFIAENIDIFDTEKLRMTSNEISESFFKKGKYPKIDELNEKITDNIGIMEKVCKALSKYIDDKNKFSKNENDVKMQLKYNKLEGHYISVTKRRADILQNNLKNVESIKVDESLTINTKQLRYKELVKGNTKIFLEQEDKEKGKDDKPENEKIKNKLIELVKKQYLEVLYKLSQKYNDMFKIISKSIAQIDFIKSNAKTARKYNYCRPTLVQNNNGYFDAKKLRHPIAERLKTDYEYVPHDISLGKPPNWKNGDELLDGILLFGLNSAGKTTLMKAIGLNLIMAQCGMFVAAEEYKYSMYETLFARITGNDNIFKGLSSFALEMTELDAILNRSNNKTLVIGDEITRGTETISGSAIITTGLTYLSKFHCSFIFATHLHEIVNLDRINKLQNMKMFHLNVEYDKEKDILIFDRKLNPGPGSPVYGLTVAKYIIKNKEFIKLAQEIQNEIQDKPNSILSGKTSRYNGNLYVDACQICNKQNSTKNDHIGFLDTHHINFQSNCTEDGFVIGKSYLPMNTKSNLIVLCKGCHYKVHHNELEIRGYVETSNGRIVDYNFIKKNSKIIKKNNKNNVEIV